VSFVVAGRSGGGGTRAGARAGQQLRPQRERARHRKGGHAARWPCSWPRARGTLGAQAAADGVLWNLVAFPDLLLAFRDEGTLPLLLNASSCCRKVLHDGEARLHQARRKYGTVYIWSQSRKRTVSQTHRLCLRLASLSVSRGDIVLCSPTSTLRENLLLDSVEVSVLLRNVPAMYEMHFRVPMRQLQARLRPTSLPLVRDVLRQLPRGIGRRASSPLRTAMRRNSPRRHPGC